jgi:YidC/Oxa1 family membrane protein insertase
MMKYMMVFIGLLFFKVASGLCVYFIASSLWGVCERKLLPRTTAAKPDGQPTGPGRPGAAQRKPSSDASGGDSPAARRKRKKNRGRK